MSTGLHQGPAPVWSDDDDPVVPRLIRLAAGFITVVGFLIMALLLAEDQVKVGLAGLHALIGVHGLVVLAILQTGQVRSAALALIGGTWVFVSLVVLGNGGLRGPSLLNYPVIVVFAGWVLGERPTRWLVGLTATFMVFLVWADGQPWMAPPDYDNTTIIVLFLSGVLALTAGVTVMSRRSYQHKLERVKQVAEDLVAREIELRKLSLLVEQSPESVVLTDVDGHIDYVNEAFVRHTGFSAAEVRGRVVWSLQVQSSWAQCQAQILTAWAQGRSWQGEMLSRRKDGSEFIEAVLMMPVRQPDGRLTHYAVLKENITEKREAQAKVHQLAYFDELTGLPNRAQLMDHLATLADQACAAAASIQHGLLLLNIDRFKHFNDAQGHDLGDALILAVSHRLRVHAARASLHARLGSDEFVVVMPAPCGPSTGEEARIACMALAQQLAQAMQEPLVLGPLDEVVIAVSQGVTLFPLDPLDTPKGALRRAHTALHHAKDGGGGRSVFFEPRMEALARERYDIERELQQALQTDELRVYLQPQVTCQGVWAGAETLLRWQHPQRGLVSPAVFIPVAEQSDLIVAVDQWVLTQSCRMLKRLTDQGQALNISVNISPRHFRRPDFVAWLQTLLADTGAPATCLTLEVTEGLVIDNLDEVVAKMRQLAALGLSFSLDDFGTGYSSLAHLKRLPIAELKIDKTFVQDAPASPENAALVETILAVAGHMGLRVVAEGVETPAQARFLQARAPDIIMQGYLFGKPAPAGEWLMHRVSDAAPVDAVKLGA